MIYLYVRQNVQDYQAWRAGFDNHAEARRAAGSTDDLFVMRNVDAPNEVTVIMGWSSADQARAFTQSDTLKEAMKNAGVMGPPEVRFLEAIS